MSQTLEVMRALNVTLMAACALGLTIRWTSTWPKVTNGGRLLRGGILVLVVGVLVSSAIKYLTHIDTDASVAIITTSALTILAGLWLSRGDHDL